jgi:mRNA interferase RelE/StbE
MKIVKEIEQKPLFKHAYKRLHVNQKIAVNEAIRAIMKNPSLGQSKKSNLSGIQVYKFDCINQQFLLAYEYNDSILALLAVGTHENFYRDLKNNLKS